MAACGSLEHIFEKPLPDNPTLLESLSSWKQIKTMKKAIDDSSFTEIFGELHFKESPRVHASPHESSLSSSSSSSHFSSPFPQSSPSSSKSTNSSDSVETRWGIDVPKKDENGSLENNSSSSSYYTSGHRDSFSSVNSENLSICTEGLGFESFDYVEDLSKKDTCINNDGSLERKEETKSSTRTKNHHWNELKRTRTSRGEFPPPISCIGSSGKPWVCFKSYRENGRFILKEVRIPTQEFLHACREDGRLKLKFIQSDDEMLEEEEDEDKEITEEKNGEIKQENGEENTCYGND